MKRNRVAQVFSLAFLDCICCGFGAMILIFVLSIGKAPERNASVISKIQEAISRISADIALDHRFMGEMEALIKRRDEERLAAIGKIDSTKKSVRDLEHELALLLAKRSALKEELDKLLGDKKAIPTQDEAPPIPIPNEQRRQYLSGFNFEGSNVLFLVESSGGMIGYSVDDVLKKLTIPDEEKRKSEKWRRVIRSVQWIIANLGAKQAYHIVTFNKEPKTLVEEREHEWLNPLDRETTAIVLRKLSEITPQGGANMGRAFAYAKDQFPAVDCIVLITDSLPTLSDSGGGSTTDDRDRESFFRAAIKELPRQVPVNTLLFPMSGDPACPYLFWQLAEATKGSLISPAPSWPDI